MWCAACFAPGDLDDPAVGEAGVQGERRLPEDRPARGAEQLEDRLADRAEPLERSGRVRLRIELARDRAGGGGATGQIGSAR